ncbi:MAG: glycosyltransferase family 61 protein [Selenomonadaceae bacterium]|nr:glycosyltransferase family 61 protein [Selenomonadaceae bacterium]
MTNLDYLYDKEAVKGLFGLDYFSGKELGFRTIERGTILPHNHTGDDGKWTWLGLGGIVDSNGEFIKESFIHTGVGGAYKPESVLKSPKTVIYLGISYYIWGHCLTDNIRRLWFLKSEFMEQFKNCPIVYIAWDKYDIEYQQNFKRLLEILGVDVSRLQKITQPTQFDKIILPDEAFYVDNRRRFTKEYCEMIERVRDFALKNRTPVANKKVYYFHGRNQIGEERLAQYFKAKGYKIIPPENLTLDEQLNWLINCESFASTLGSCAHNSIFLRDGTETIFIPRSSDRFTVYQQALNQIRPLKDFYVDSSMSVFNQAFGVYCYIVSRQLKEFFGDKWAGYDEGDFKIFLRYVKSSLDNGVVVNPKIKSSYDKILPDFLAQLKQHKDLIAVYDLPPDWEKALS